jgi:hypothetical protein
MLAGFIPVAFVQTLTPFVIPGKDSGWVVLNDRPIDAETSLILLLAMVQNG